MNRNFVEMLSALCAAQAEFLVVGGWAVTVHGFTRYTGDFDVWVRADQANSHRVYAALAAFGATLGELDRAELAVPGIVYQMGLPPQHIDIITELEGVDFEGAWSRRMMVQSVVSTFPSSGSTISSPTSARPVGPKTCSMSQSSRRSEHGRRHDA